MAGLLALCASTASAATRALVVGVSGYPKLPERVQLVGPKNDSREFANTLARLGVPVSDITVLADQVTGLADGIANPGVGDKAAILERLAALADTSKPGDLVVFYFSGHGSQQPDLDGDEEGGADEIFLPYDVGKWTGEGVSNAIVDDELNVLVERILAKGADFFGIIDACHSATGFRAFDGDDTRLRGVDPTELGVPAFAQGAGRGLTRQKSAAGETEGRGRAAFFYAAQENEEALEKTPKGSKDGESYAVFTYELVRRLNQSSGMTYRALHQAILSDIKRNTLMSTQTPELEGELLDEPVLGLARLAPQRQWQVMYGGKLQGGVLNGLTTGSLLALYDDATAPDDKPVAHATIDSAGATKSLLKPAAAPCEADEAVCATAVADDATFRLGRFARMVQPGVDVGLVLSEPLRVDPSDGKDYAYAKAALRGAVASGPSAARISMRSTGYDIAVALVDGTLAFSAPGGFDRSGPGSSPRLTLPDDPETARTTIAEAVDRMARATALQRLGGGADGARSLGLVPVLSLSKSMRRPETSGACSQDEADYAPAQPVGDDPRFDDCDIVSVRMENTGRKPLDVTVLLIGADFSITTVWPVEGQSSRILAQESKSANMLQMEPDPAAATEERLVFLAVPGVNRSHTAFTDLQQEGLRAAPDDAPEIVAVRDFMTSGLNDMSRSTVRAAARVEEDMSIDIVPFFVTKGGGG